MRIKGSSVTNHILRIHQNYDLIIFSAFLILTVSYVLITPAFEGPDESEHCRYIQAFYNSEVLHPIDLENPFRFGYVQLIHPPLYHWLAAQYAKIIKPEFHKKLAVNSQQNPKFPYLRHDIPGEKFPYDPVNRTLRLLRLLSVITGILVYIWVTKCFILLFPEQPYLRRIFVALCMLTPNMTFAFVRVSNDPLIILLSVLAVYMALKTMQSAHPDPRLFFWTGAILGVGYWTKIHILLTVATIGTMWLIDMIVNKRYHFYFKGALYCLPPFLILTGVAINENLIMYGSPTRENILIQVAPAVFFDTPLPLFTVLKRIFLSFPDILLADLCWQTARLESVSKWIFPLWLFGCIAPLFVLAKTNFMESDRRRKRWPVEILISPICLFWILAFLIVINRSQSNLQVRHVLCLFPFTLIGIFIFFNHFLSFRIYRFQSISIYLLLCLMMVPNVVLLQKINLFYQPHPSPVNRDYETFLYNYVKSRFRGNNYLMYGNFYTSDYKKAINSGEFRKAIVLCKLALEQGQWPEFARYYLALSYFELKQTKKSLDTLLPSIHSFPPSYALYPKILVALGRKKEARAYIEDILPKAKAPKLIHNLKTQLKKLQ